MVPVIVVFPLARVGLKRIIVFQRLVAVGIGRVQPVELGQGNGLYHGEAFGGAVFEVSAGFLARKAVKQFPGRIAEVEERTPAGTLQEMAVGRNRKARQHAQAPVCGTHLSSHSEHGRKHDCQKVSFHG